MVSALRPVVLLPECLAPRLIRNLLDLPSSRLDFQVCPAGEPATWWVAVLVWGGGVCIWVAVDSQPCGPESCTSLFSTESLSGEEQCTSSAPGAPKAWPANAGLGSRIRAIQESVGKVSAGGGKAALWDPEPASGPPLGLGQDDNPWGLLEEWADLSLAPENCYS